MSSNSHSDTGFWSDVLGLLRNELRRIELYFEGRRGADIAWRIFTLAIAITTAVAKAGDLLAGDLAVWILLVIIVVLLALDSGHLLLARRRRLETLARDEDIRLLSAVISDTGRNLSSAPYRIVKLRQYRRIYENGDTDIRREAIVECLSDPILLNFVETWLVDSDEMASAQEMDFKAFSMEDEAPLLSVIVENRGAKKKFAVVLDPPARNQGERTSLVITMKSPRAWERLFTHNEDRGAIEVTNQTDEFVLIFQLPKGWAFTHFKITPRPSGLEQPIIVDNDFGDSVLTVVLRNLTRGEKYSYQLLCKKRN